MVQEVDAVLVGVQGTVVLIQPPTTFINDALTTALAALPPQGGDLYVLPGTQPYVFSNSVLVDKPNVTLHFSRGAILQLGSQAPALVRVRAERFRCIGAHVDQIVTATHSGISCFLVESQAGATSDEASFVECHFRIQQAAADIVGFSCIRAVGPAVPASPRRGLCVADSTFVVVDPGVQQTDAFTGSDPHGVCMIRAEDCVDTIVRGNHFRGSKGTTTLHGGPMIFARGVSGVVVSDNVFRDMVANPLNGEQALIDIVGAAAADDLGLALARNVFEGANVGAVVRVEGGRGIAMTAFNFGRMIGETRAGLLLVPSAAGEPVAAVAVHGGNLHNVNRIDGYMIRADAVRDLSISGNAFSIVGATQEYLSFAPGECRGVVVSPRQPREVKL